MNTSQVFNDLMPEETAEEKIARENRLKIYKINCEFRKIDYQRIRPMAAIQTGKATEEDRAKLSDLESRAQALRKERDDLI